jgi:hypothetical protein
LQFRMVCGAGQATRFLASGSEKSRSAGLRGIEISDKPTQTPVHTPNAMDARDDFLANVATLLEIHCYLVKAGFLRKSVLGEFAPPVRDATFNPQQLDFVAPGLHQILRRIGKINALNAEPSNAHAPLSRRKRAEDVAAQRILRHQLKHHIVGDRVSLETGGQAFLERRISLHDERISVHPHKDVGAKLAFCGKDQGSYRLARHEAAQIIAQLAIEIPKTVRTGDANTRSRAWEEKSSFPSKLA